MSSLHFGQSESSRVPQTQVQAKSESTLFITAMLKIQVFAAKEVLFSAL